LTGLACAPARRTHGPIAAPAAASDAVPRKFRRVTCAIVMSSWDLVTELDGRRRGAEASQIYTLAGVRVTV
jgi:hypothetical protein